MLKYFFPRNLHLPNILTELWNLQTLQSTFNACYFYEVGDEWSVGPLWFHLHFIMIYFINKFQSRIAASILSDWLVSGPSALSQTMPNNDDIGLDLLS